MKKQSWYVVGCYVLWGVLPIFWKFLQSVNSLYLLAARIVWALVFCGIIILFSSGKNELKSVMRNKRQFLLSCLCGLFVSINWGGYIIAVNSDHILEGSLAYYMNPIFAILAGSIFFKERLSVLQWISVALAFTGVLVSVIAYGSVPYLALTIAISFAIYSSLKKKVTIESTTVSLFIETLAMTPISIAFMIYMEIVGNGSIGVLHSWQFLLLPISGIITAIPLLLFGKGIKHTSVSMTGILMYINPTMQLLIGVFLYNEEFSSTQAVTFAFVWAALIMFVVGNIVKMKKEAKTLTK